MAGDSVIVMLDGVPFTGWKKVTVSQAFDKATGECSLTISPLPGNPLPADVGSTAQVILAGRPVITGHVHEVTGSHGWGEHDIELSIRDKTQDMIDSTVGPGVEFKPPIQLKQVLDGTLKKMGLSGIKVIDKANPEPYRKGGEVPVAAIDDTGFGYADQWAKKRQVVLNTDGEGNLVIDRNRKQRGPGALIKMFEDSPLNNVKKATYKNSDSGRHNKTDCHAQKSTNDLDYWESRPKGDEPAQSNPLSTKTGTATDSGIRPERKLHYRARQGIEGKTPEQAAKWRTNLARARNYTYEAEVSGFEMAPGQLWWPGFIVPVRDDHFLISDEMFIKEVTFTKDWDGGAVTQISLTAKDAYSEIDEAPKSRTGKAGLGTKPSGSF